MTETRPDKEAPLKMIEAADFRYVSNATRN